MTRRKVQKSDLGWRPASFGGAAVEKEGSPGLPQVHKFDVWPCFDRPRGDLGCAQPAAGIPLEAETFLLDLGMAVGPIIPVQIHL
jgi:hypothetical protein